MVATERADKAAAQLLREEQAAAEAERRAQAQVAAKKDKKARQKQRKQVCACRAPLPLGAAVQGTATLHLAVKGGSAGQPRTEARKVICAGITVSIAYGF